MMSRAFNLKPRLSGISVVEMGLDELRRRKKNHSGHLIQNLKVYLCGPINGCNDSECKDWREYAKLIIRKAIDPMARDYRGRELEPGIVREIVENDKADIESCDWVLVYYDRPSVGTAMEVLYANQHHKGVVIVDVSAKPLSPWMSYHSDCSVPTLNEALEFLKNVEGPDEDTP